MHTIAIIGAGNLGGRHLQALAALKEPADLYACDVSEASLQNAAGWFWAEKPGTHLSLHLCRDVAELPEALDLVIMATSSAVRASLSEQLLTTKRIRYLILEKVLFQREADYQKIGDLLESSGCKAWVNCPRRTVRFYRELAKLMGNESYLEFQMNGANWGLGCNSVHFLDLFALMTGAPAQNLQACLDAEMLESKRQGYKEFTGRITGEGPRGSHVSIMCTKGAGIPAVLTFRSPHYICIVKEYEQKALLMRSENNWEVEEFTLDSKPQSRLTNLVADEIFATGSCMLTPYIESVAIHLPFIRAMLKTICQMQGKDTDICPIT